MGRNFQYLLVIVLQLICTAFSVKAQTTTVVILDQHEINNLKTEVNNSPKARNLADSILLLAEQAFQRTPRPLEVVYYEGLLPTNPNRIDTRISLQDVDVAVNLIYASYLSDDPRYAEKAAEFALSWASRYQPTGNPINENKFVAFYWIYHLFGDVFSEGDKKVMEDWMREIVRMEMERKRTPNNNWQAKRMKMIGIIGCILDDQSYQDFALEGFKKYLGSAYYADGTSRDLRQRDALHYHLSGIKPALSFFINLSSFNNEFELYEFEGDSGGSIKKSLEFTLPYARGEKQHAEWVNTTVKLDKERAAAGLAEYQPGMLFDPADAIPAFEWAIYYNSEWIDIIDANKDFATTWVGLLNSPLIRDK
jgi:hypothetical protein